MKGNRGVRIAFAIIVLLLFGFYLYAHVSAGPFSDDAGTFHLKGQENASPADKAPAEPTPVIETPEPTPTPAPTPTIDPNSPEGRAAALGLPKPPDIDITSWEFLMANPDHSIAEYEPPLATLEQQQFDERIIEPMTAFVQAARDQGLNVYLSSGYRGFNEQSYLFNRKIGQGYSQEDAAKIVAVPGTSEHQTGLACDITDRYYDFKTSDLENTELYKWMSAHCQEYGFIVRFPKDKEDITKIIYEPWHFRYVGVEAANYMVENNLCYEEFYALYTGE